MQNYFNPYYQAPAAMVPGRIVNDYSDIGINEVPMTGVALFPKADRSSVQMREWCSDGTIRTTVYLAQNQIQMDKSASDSEKGLNGQIWAEIEGIKEELKTLTERIDKPTRRRKETDEL